MYNQELLPIVNFSIEFAMNLLAAIDLSNC